MLYSPDDWYLMLVDHKHSFDPQTGLPTSLQDVELVIGDQWRAALINLDDEALRTGLGDVLDKERLAALGNRRDALIENAIH
jgi:hypothetical protein